MTKHKLNFGIVGAGGIARAYAEAFKDCETARLVAVADINPDAARALAEKAGCESFDSYEALAERTALDAVVVCTPPVTHPEICLYFVGRKTHVLCEKPLSINSESARAMLDAAKRAGVLLTMASKFRYVADVIRAKEFVTQGLLGEIILFENAFTSRVEMFARWNSNPSVSGGGVLIDNGTHSVDLMRYFLGPLADVQVIEGKHSQGLVVEETVRIFVRSAGGVMGSIDLSWSLNKELDSYISVYGSEGTLHVGWKESKYRQAHEGEWVVFGRGYDKVEAFRSQIRNFSRAIKGEESLLITADDALASVEAVEAAYEALRQSRWTTLESARDMIVQHGGEMIIEARDVA